MSKAIDTHTYSFQLHNRFSTDHIENFKKKYKNKKPVQPFILSYEAYLTINI